MEDDLDSVTLEQFRYSQLNRSGSDEEAKAMFDADRAEIAARDWTWYRDSYWSDEAARAAWRHQRLRYGLPTD
jgi:hypothetical protein